MNRGSIGDACQIILTILVFLILLAGIWIYSFQEWGTLLALVFGWIPAVIAGVLGGLITYFCWPIVALGLVWLIASLDLGENVYSFVQGIGILIAFFLLTGWIEQKYRLFIEKHPKVRDFLRFISRIFQIILAALLFYIIPMSLIGTIFLGGSTSDDKNIIAGMLALLPIGCTVGIYASRKK